MPLEPAEVRGIVVNAVVLAALPESAGRSTAQNCDIARHCAGGSTRQVISNTEQPGIFDAYLASQHDALVRGIPLADVNAAEAASHADRAVAGAEAGRCITARVSRTLALEPCNSAIGMRG